MRSPTVPNVYGDPRSPSPEPDRRPWYRRRVPRFAHRRFDGVLPALVGVVALGWSFGLIRAANEATSTAAGRSGPPVAVDGMPEAVLALDELTRTLGSRRSLRGRSGALRVVVLRPGGRLPLPDSVIPEDVAVELTPVPEGRPDPGPGVVPVGRSGEVGPGVWALTLRSEGTVRAVPDVRILTQLPLSERRGESIGRYLVGRWPFETSGTPPNPAYAPPRGVVRVREQDVDVPVSEHVTLGDFLTKGQPGVWPKYVVLSTRVLDKLELTLQELGRTGHPVTEAGVISGFRTPYYNEHGGDPRGRGRLSRHMYGDAMDFYVDGDRDGCMDDLTGDGRIDVEDAEVLARAAERVERLFPELVGGISAYPPTSAHCGFVHVDTRGRRARW